ncbi:hypothetical protein KY333_04040 [Candidatus Woesearchaeota archaeon]|nr:hypothetical protein [Candidatus Woesearchaeota archaeon]
MRVSEDFEFYFSGPTSILETEELNESDLLKLFPNYSFDLVLKGEGGYPDESSAFPPISLRLNLYFSLIQFSEENLRAAIRRESESVDQESFRNQMKMTCLKLREYYNRTNELRERLAEDIESNYLNETERKAKRDSSIFIDYLKEAIHGLFRWLWEDYNEIIKDNFANWTELVYGDQKGIWLLSFKAHFLSITLFEKRNRGKGLNSLSNFSTGIIDRAKNDLINFYQVAKQFHSDILIMNLVCKLENEIFLAAFPEYAHFFEQRFLDSKHHCKEGFKKIKESFKQGLADLETGQEAMECLETTKERASQLYWIFENSPIEGSLIKMFYAYLEEITQWPNAEDSLISFDKAVEVFECLKKYVSVTDHPNLKTLLEGKRPSSRIYWEKSVNQFSGLLEDLEEAEFIQFKTYEKVFANWLHKYFDYTPERGSNAGKIMPLPQSDPSYKYPSKRPQKGSPNRLRVL